MPTTTRTIKKEALRWLEAAPVNWQSMVDNKLNETGPNGTDYLYELASFLRDLTIRSARLMEYIETRDWYRHKASNEAHSASVADSNHRVRKVRKALGYTQAADDIRF